MIEEVKNRLRNADFFKDCDYKEDILGLIDAVLEYSLEPGINIYDLRELLLTIKEEIE